MNSRHYVLTFCIALLLDLKNWIRNCPRRFHPHTECDKINLAIQVESMDKGGLEQVVYNLVKYIDKERFNVTLVICCDSLGYLGEKVKSEGYDVVTVGKNMHALKQVVKQRSFHVVNLHYSVWAVDVYNSWGIATVYTIHNSYTWLDNKQVEERRKVFTNIDSFIAVSNQVKDYSANRFGIDCSRIRVIPNGMDFSEFDQPALIRREQYGLKDGDIVFVSVSSITPVKMQNLLLSAVKALTLQYPAVKLVLVGNVADLNYYEFLQTRVVQEDLSNSVHFLNFLPKAKLSGLLRVSDCFVLPSLQEGWSNAIMEGLYSGLPLILSDTGSARDIVVGNDVGTIILNPYSSIDELDSRKIKDLAYSDHSKNLESLKQAMIHVVENSSLWKEKGMKGREKVLGFSVYSMTEQYEAIFETLCENCSSIDSLQ